MIKVTWGTSKQLLIFLSIILLVGFMCIAPSINWYGTPQFKLLVQSKAKYFYLKLSEEKYQDIYSEADQRTKSQTNETDFCKGLADTRSKIGSLEWQETTCIRAAATSIIEKIKADLGIQAYIKDTCITHGEKDSAVGEFVWVVQGNDAKLVSYKIKPPSF